MGNETESRVEAILYGVAAFTGIVAVLFFSFNVDFQISPVTRFVMLAVIGVWIIIGGQFAETQNGVLASYAVAVVSWMSAAVQLIELLSLGNIGFVLIFTAVSLLFAGLARWVRSGKLQPLKNDTPKNGVIGGLATLLFIVVLLIDVFTGGIAFTLATADVTTDAVGDESTVKLGTLEAKNNGILPYKTEDPRYEACLAGNWSTYPTPDRTIPVRLEQVSSSDVLSGGEETTRDLYTFRVRPENGTEQFKNVPIVKSEDCVQDDTGERRIIVYKVEDGGIRPV